ncbi:NAD(P)-dependent oxidoreductase [Microbulbifer hainanensis]|uniref:NAD(P)-dependent oxidoreductase n=1 Tax=Microbulbifer hainanensis TaxID=2735675 RepID=UPI001867F26F|nr:NAD(P)-dependent oxidoreductase [Microbulbifer hainanensis]
MRLGFIGLGAMGRPMAVNLLRANYPVKVWARNQTVVQALVEEGAESVASARELADVDVLFSMLSDDTAVRDLLLDGGILAGMRRESIHVNMATVSLRFARELASAHAERGIGYVAAPVLGRTDVAAAGKLNILAAGADDAIGRVQPLLDILGQRTWHFGTLPERANAVKIAANFSIACALEAMGESFALVRAQGIDAANFLDLLVNTLFAGAPVYKGYGAMIAQQRFEPAGFKLPLGLKDVQLAMQAAEEAHLPLPFASILRDNLLDAIAQGDAELDWSAVAKVAARRGGLT